MEEKRKSGSVIGGVVFVGCMFVGVGIGMMYDAMQLGGAIGMGLGFIGMGATWAYYRTNKSKYILAALQYDRTTKDCYE